MVRSLCAVNGRSLVIFNSLRTLDPVSDARPTAIGAIAVFRWVGNGTLSGLVRSGL